MSFTVKQLAERFGGTVKGDDARTVTSLAPLDSATPAQLAFLANPKYLAQVLSSQAGTILISARDLDKLSEPDLKALSAVKTWIVAANPYAYFARVAQMFVASADPVPQRRRHPSALIDSAAKVADSASIGPHVVVEAGVVIGERVRIEANVFIGRDTRIGDDSRLYPNTTIYHGCCLGERVIVHAGAVIGADGFGFAPDFAKDPNTDASVEGEWIKIPQVGGVRIGNDVEVGANTTIDRGAMADTVIEHAVKIDNQVQIGHNCRIGAYTVIAGCAGIAGSTVIGRHCMIGGAVGIAGHVTLADRVVVTAKSGVSKSLTRAGVYTSAFPAVDNLEWNKNAAIMRNLDKMRDRVKQLEAAVSEMRAAGKDEQ